ncbi:MAG TPA: hypothetical protein VGH49_16455 [Xanthobacteraceae bacterium]
MALSVASNATILAARYAYAKPSRAAAASQSAVSASFNSAVPSATAASTISDVKPATPVAGISPSALAAAAGEVSGLTSRVDGNPTAFSSSVYARAIAAYTGQSVTAVVSLPAANVTPVDGANNASGVPVAPAPQVSQATAGVGSSAAGSSSHAGNDPGATLPGAPDAVASTENSNLAAQAAIASPPSVLPQAGGQPNPIAAPTQHAVMSLLKIL